MSHFSCLGSPWFEFEFFWFNGTGGKEVGQIRGSVKYDNKAPKLNHEPLLGWGMTIIRWLEIPFHT